MVEKLVFVRHGEYKGDDLTSNGEASIRALTPKVKATFAGASPILVLSSPRKRAIQTANILCKGLALDIPGFQTHEELAEELRDLVTGLEKTHKFFLPAIGDAKNVLVSTHKPLGSYYPWWFAKQLLGEDLQSENLDFAEANVLDMVAKTITRI